MSEERLADTDLVLLDIKSFDVRTYRRLTGGDFSYGTVVCAPLPGGAKDGEAVAEYKNSVLTIMVPVQETGPELIQVVLSRSRAV